jgi:hypothetical protein
LKRYLAIPKTSSERRDYIPLGYLEAETIASTELFTVDGATLYHIGILTSTLHMAWMRAVCGRLESRYHYSAGIVYNNFRGPPSPQPSPRLRLPHPNPLSPLRLPHPNPLPEGEGANAKPKPIQRRGSKRQAFMPVRVQPD